MNRFFCYLVVLLLGATSLHAAVIEGRVVLGDEPLREMIVQAYASLDPTSKRLGAPVLTDDAGRFRLEAPAGYLALYARSQDGRFFAVCGRNPLLASEDAPRWAGLQAVEVRGRHEEPYADEYSAGLEGVVLRDGKPVEGAYVSLYLDAAEDLKGQGYRISTPTAADGYFVFDGLPESSYFLLARKRQNGARVGPLREGDLFGVFDGNPLTLKAGSLVGVSLPLLERQPSAEALAGPDRQGAIRLRGRVVDGQGQPLSGLHFFAYRDPVIGHQRPVALSPPSDADGTFEASLREPGLYYVGARQEYGDSPAPGELFGLYEGRADHGLMVESDGNREIVIQVAPISLD